MMELDERLANIESELRMLRQGMALQLVLAKFISTYAAVAGQASEESILVLEHNLQKALDLFK